MERSQCSDDDNNMKNSGDEREERKLSILTLAFQWLFKE